MHGFGWMELAARGWRRRAALAALAALALAALGAGGPGCRVNVDDDDASGDDDVVVGDDDDDTTGDDDTGDDDTGDDDTALDADGDGYPEGQDCDVIHWCRAFALFTRTFR